MIFILFIFNFKVLFVNKGCLIKVRSAFLFLVFGRWASVSRFYNTYIIEWYSVSHNWYFCSCLFSVVYCGYKKSTAFKIAKFYNILTKCNDNLVHVINLWYHFSSICHFGGIVKKNHPYCTTLSLWLYAYFYWKCSKDMEQFLESND